MKKFVALTIIFIFTITVGFSTNYYVSTSGSNSNSGSISSPFLTITQAVSVAVAGDYIYVRGGTYDHPTIRLTKSGTSSALIYIMAYGDEIPILDFQNIASSDRGFRITGSYWYIKGLIIQNSPNHGITITGSNITVENCVTRYNGDMGLNLTSGASDCLILNCDSYYNFDTDNAGENADGFAAKYSIGTGNIFRNCRAWHNSDDGWDLWQAGNSVRLENCWAFENGDNFKDVSSFAGDGNGFKLGTGSGRHVLVRCVAWDNYLGNGFEDNSNTSGVEFYNCTSYNNKGYNYETKSSVNHIVKNNISYLGKGVSFSSATVASNNSWSGFTVTAGDFLSLDDTIAKGNRNTDGSLPVSNFLHLASSSDLIDAGIDVGLSYNGSAPDLGAFESDATSTASASVGTDKNSLQNDAATESLSNAKNSLGDNYPNPFTNITFIPFTLAQASEVEIQVTDILGRKVTSLGKQSYPVGTNFATFETGSLNSGIYFYVLIVNGKHADSKKMTIQNK
jgi:pectate disaccharide-lyase